VVDVSQNNVMTCLSGAAGQRRRRCTRLVWREEDCAEEEVEEEEILTRTQINAPSDIKTHLGGIDDRVTYILKY